MNKGNSGIFRLLTLLEVCHSLFFAACFRLNGHPSLRDLFIDFIYQYDDRVGSFSYNQ